MIYAPLLIFISPMHLLKELSKFKIVCKANSGCGCCASMYMALPFVDDGTFLKLFVAIIGV